MVNRLPWTLTFLSGILLVTAFPRPDHGWLAWFALVPLLLALSGQSGPRSFVLAYFSGLIFFLGTVNWVTNTMVQYGGLPLVLSYAIMFLLVAYLALYFGFFGLLLNLLSRSKILPAWFLAPILWVSLEFLRTHALSGFPWASLGYTQYRFLPVIQVADLTGVAGVGFLIVLVNAAIAELFLALGNRRLNRAWGVPPAVAGIVVLLVLGYGEFRLAQDKADSPPTFRAGIIQANIPQDVKWDDAFRNSTIDRYERLTRSLTPEKPELIVWPEAAMPFLLEENPPFRERVGSMAREVKTPLLVGSPALHKGSDRIRLLNSAFLLSETGTTLGRYDKHHLVPFGEYVPMESILFFVNKMVKGIGDFIPGQELTLLPHPRAKIGTVICYEVIFPNLVRKIVGEGADVMTTITNDAWFGDSSAPHQHFAMVALRAVENRVSFIRSANTGISGFIDRTGRIQKSSPTFVVAAIADTVRLRTQSTFFTRFGELFSIACVTISAGLLGGVLFRRK